MMEIVLALIAVGGTWGAWIVRGRMEEWRDEREALRQERRERYAQVLNPYVQVLAARGDEARSEEVKAVMLSAEYRKELLDLAVVAEDEVIRAYNGMMSDFKEVEEATGGDRRTVLIAAIKSFGGLLLEIRRSLGNRDTELTEPDLLEVIGIRDARQFLSGQSPPSAEMDDAVRRALE